MRNIVYISEMFAMCKEIMLRRILILKQSNDLQLGGKNQIHKRFLNLVGNTVFIKRHVLFSSSRRMAIQYIDG